MSKWWLICQENVDNIRKNFDKIIDFKTKDSVESAIDALMMFGSKFT